MKGTIDNIEDKKKKNGEPYQVITIDDQWYSVWEFELIKGLEYGQIVEFEFTESGKYKNLTEIKALPGVPSTQRQPTRYDATKTWNTSLMCAKDLVVALIEKGEGGNDNRILGDEAESLVIKMGLAFYKASENGTTEPEQKTEEDVPMFGSENMSDFDSFNYQIVNTKWNTKKELADWWDERQKSMLKFTDDERKKLIKAYSEELSKTK